MDYVIAIPTLSRPCALKKKTLHLLETQMIPKDKIYIFVVDEEYEMYASLLSEEYNIVIGQRGIANQRNFISNYFKIDQYIVSFDDDITDLMFLEDGKELKSIYNLKNVIDFMINVMDSGCINLAGVYPVSNAFFMKDTITTDLRFIIGGWFIYCNQKLMLDIRSESKEDYENTLLYFLNNGSVMRFNNLCFKSRKHSEGGLGRDRKARNVQAAKYLVETYDEMVSYKKDTLEEIRLKRINY